jgi:hypothetical protein
MSKNDDEDKCYANKLGMHKKREYFLTVHLLRHLRYVAE